MKQIQQKEEQKRRQNEEKAGVNDTTVQVRFYIVFYYHLFSLSLSTSFLLTTSSFLFLSFFSLGTTKQNRRTGNGT